MREPTASRLLVVSTVVMTTAVMVAVPACLLLQLSVVGASIPITQWGYLFSIFGAPIACALICVVVLVRPRDPKTIAQAAVVGFLAGWAPICLAVFVRLSSAGCLTLTDPFGFPWTEPWRSIGYWGCGSVWLIATCAVIVALAVRRLRRAGIAMCVWSGAMVAPMLFLLFLSTYGDPGATCVHV